MGGAWKSQSLEVPLEWSDFKEGIWSVPALSHLVGQEDIRDSP